VARQISTITGLFAVLILGVGLIGGARAEDCPHGDLDQAYCDRDGDLVADAPTDPKAIGQSIDPDLRLYPG
jgi:phosphonate transport system substrate-binding protein